jgi:hypothetical protein
LLRLAFATVLGEAGVAGGGAGHAASGTVPADASAGGHPRVRRAGASRGGARRAGGQRTTVGAVALPAAGFVLHTGQPPGVAPATPGPVRIAVSRTRPPACAQQLAARLGAGADGSAGAKAMAIVRGHLPDLLICRPELAATVLAALPEGSP